MISALQIASERINVGMQWDVYGQISFSLGMMIDNTGFHDFYTCVRL